MNIYDLAKISGLSVSTISKVINGKSGVSDETRKTVLELMKSTNFNPRISANIQDYIGVVFWDNGANRPLSSLYISKILEGITDYLIKQDLYATLIPIDKVPTERYEFMQFCQKRKLAGLIFLTLRESNRIICDFADFAPMVLVGTDFGDAITSIRSNSYQGAYRAVSHFIHEGHKSICILCPDYNMQDHADRRMGYIDALKDNGIPIREDLIIDNAYKWEPQLTLIFEHLVYNKPNPPTALFICDETTLSMVVSIFKRLKLSVPDDISLICFDDYEYAQYFNPPLSTVVQPLYELGKNAAEKLVSQIDNENDVTEHIVLDTDLVLRKSVKRIV